MKVASINGEIAWAAVFYHIKTYKSFKSVTGISYEARIKGDLILYKGGERNEGEEETINRVDFINAFETVKGVEDINTNTIKTLVPNAFYRKRTPFIGMLFSAGVLKKAEN